MKPVLSLKYLDSKIETLKDSLLELYHSDRNIQKEFNNKVQSTLSDMFTLYQYEIERDKRFRICFSISLVLISISLILSCF